MISGLGVQTPHWAPGWARSLLTKQQKQRKKPPSLRSVYIFLRFYLLVRESEPAEEAAGKGRSRLQAEQGARCGPRAGPGIMA